MSTTAFNRARRLAAQQSGKPMAELSYQEAIAILRQRKTELEAEQSDRLSDLESEPAEVEQSDRLSDLKEIESESQSAAVLTRDDRTTQLKAMNWEALRDLLKSYELSTAKPKGISWDDFAIPQILEHEGF